MKLPLQAIGSFSDWRTGETWSGERIRNEAISTYERLQSTGVGPGRHVVITHGGTPAFFADLLAVWRAGACAVCLNPNTTPDELATITDYVEPTAVLPLEGACVTTAPAADAAGSLDDDALILFTSGTTGIPKGVVHTYRSILARVALNQAYIGAAALRRTLCVLPTHFGHGLIGNCLTPLLAGKDLVLAPATNLDVPANLGRLIDDYEITFMSSVPTLWKKALGVASPAQGTTLQRVHVGSAPLSAGLWEEIAGWSGTRDVVNMYGITETANWLGGASLAEHEAQDGLIGRMWGGAAAVLTEDGEIRAEGDGEITVQSPSLMRGYFRQPDATGSVLQNGWFRTGDTGHIDASGIMRLTGRRKHEINRGGIKVHPEDIDMLLERHDAVREVCAFPVPDLDEGETIGVAVSLRNGCDIDEKALRRWCLQRISREKVPVRWVILEEIPKTDRGKINRADVARYCLDDIAGDQAADASAQ